MSKTRKTTITGENEIYPGSRKLLANYLSVYAQQGDDHFNGIVTQRRVR
jgi:hypothetical protein